MNFDISNELMIGVLVVAVVVGIGIIGTVISATTNVSTAVNETLGVADSTGYLAATLAHTPFDTPSIVCSGG